MKFSLTKKNAYCQLITVFYPVNFPERISKVFLNHFKKMRACVSMAAVKSCMVCPVDGAQQPWASQDDQPIRASSWQTPLKFTLERDKAFGRYSSHHCRSKARAKEGPLGITVQWTPWGRDWATIIFEPLLPSMVPGKDQAFNKFL